MEINRPEFPFKKNLVLFSFVLLLLVIQMQNLFAATYYSRAAGGWNVPSNWSTASCGGAAATSAPGATDDVIICHAITFNATITVNNVTVNSGGNLSFDNISRNVTINGNLTISSGGVFEYNLNAGMIHTLNLQGNITNNGTFDLNKDADDKVSLIFSGSLNSTVTGTGGFAAGNVFINKSSVSYITEVKVNGFYNPSYSLFSITKGTYYHSSTDTVNTGTPADFDIPAAAFIRVNSGVFNFSPTSNQLNVYGRLDVTGGVVNVARSSSGSTGGGLKYYSNAEINISGNSITNVFQGFNSAGGADVLKFTMTGGILNINSGSTITNQKAFEVADVSGSVFRMTGGNIIIHNSATGTNSDFGVCGSQGTVDCTGGTVEFGSGLSNTTPPLQEFTFTAYPTPPVLPNIKVTGPAAIGFTLRPNNSGNFKFRSLYIDAGKYFDIRDLNSSTDTKSMTLTATNPDVNLSFFDNNNETTDHFLYRNSTVIIENSSSISPNRGATIKRFYNLSLASSGQITRHTTDFAIAKYLILNGGEFTSSGLTVGLYDTNPFNTTIAPNSKISTGTLYFIAGTTQTIPGYDYNCNVMVGNNNTVLTQGGPVTCNSLAITSNGSTTDKLTYNTLNYNLTTRNGITTGVGGGSTPSNKTLNLGINTVTCGSDFRIETDGAVGAASGTIIVNGNWINTTTVAGKFNYNTSTVIFGGTFLGGLASTLGETFYNLGINKSADLNLNSPVTVKNTATFTNGRFNSTITSKLIFAAGATHTGASDASFVSGPAQRYGTGTFDFPIGKGSTYKPLGISPAGLATDAYSAEYFNADPNGSYNVNLKESTLENISRCEYWNLSQDAGSTATKVSLGYGTGSCNKSQFSSFKVSRWDPALTLWTDKGRGTSTGNATSGKVESSGTTNSFGTFTLAYTCALAAPAASDVARCGAGLVTLTATGSPGTYNWYAASSGGSSLAGLDTYSTTVSTTTRYFVSSYYDGCESPRTAVYAIISNPNVSVPASSVYTCNGKDLTALADGYYKSLRLDGADDYLQAPAGVYFSGGDFTIEGWVNVKAYNKNSRLIDFGNGSSSDNVFVALSERSTGKIHFSVYQGSTGSSISSSKLVPLNQWAHIACVFSGTTGKIYLNGELVGSGTVLIPNNISRSSCLIGKSNWGIDELAKTDIDELRIWNTARTQAEINAGMETRVPLSSPGLTQYWTIEEGSGSIITDSKSSSIATATGSPIWLNTSAPIGITYTWSPSTNLSSTSGKTVIASPATSTIYTVTANYPGGCVASNTITANPITPGDPTVFGNGTWNVFGYSKNNYTDYSGYYTEPSLSFSTTSRWDPNTTPSNASGYQGCVIPADTHSYVHKRTNIPDGIYKIDINRNDNEVKLLIDGVQKFSDLLNNSTRTAWIGKITTSSKVEIKNMDYNSFSLVDVSFTSIANPGITPGTVSGNQNFCNSGDPVAFTSTVDGSSICSNFAWQWQSSPDGSAWSDISGAITSTYDPTTLATTTYYRRKVTDDCGNIDYSNTIIINIFKPAAPAATGGSICGSGSVSLSASGATDYKWYAVSSGNSALNTGTPFSTPVISATTPYYVAAIDVNGCESISRTAVTATVLNIPAAPIAVNAARCGTGTVGLAATGATIYKWYGSISGVDSIQRGQNYTTPSIAGTTTYYVSAISTQGCESTTRTPVTATINTIPNAPTAVDAARCGAGQVALSANGATIYKWYGSAAGVDSLQRGQNYTTPSIAGTTTYYVSAISAQGCESTTRTTVTATINIIPTAPTAVNAARCGTGTVGLAATGATIYKWYGSVAGFDSLQRGQNYTTPSITGTTTYYVSAISTQGCESTTRTPVTATINTIPAAPIAANASRCGTGTVVLSATGATIYKWYGSVAGVDSLQRGQNYTTPSITGTTTYFVSAISSQGCESTNRTPVTATINIIPTSPTAVNAARCGTGTVVLSATEATIYKWYGSVAGVDSLQRGQNYTTPAIAGTTTYYVSAISTQGCESTTRTPVTATINTIPTAPTAIDASRCGNGTVGLSANGAAIYKWYGSAAGVDSLQRGQNYTTPSITGTTTYYVSAISTQGCESTTRTPVTATINTIPAAPTAVNAARCGTGTVGLSANGAAIYKWYGSVAGVDSLQRGQNYITPSIAGTTTYYVSAISTQGCESTTRTPVTATINTIPTAPVAVNGSNCGTGNVSLSATGATIYKWYGSVAGLDSLQRGQNYTTPSIAGTTSYYVSAISTQGCESTTRTPVTATINTIPTAPIAADAARCGAGTVALSATGATIYKWYGSAAGIDSLQRGQYYTTPSIAGTTTYFVSAISTQACESTTRTPVTATINTIPAAPAAIDAARCGSGTVVLSANGATIYKWYGSVAGFDSLQRGQNYTTPSIAVTTIYYVSAISIQACESTTRTPVTATINTIPTAPTTVNAARCGTGTVALSAIGATIYKWYGSVAGVDSLRRGQNYTTPSIAGTTTYYVSAISAQGCESTTRTAVTATINTIPIAPTAIDAARCGAGTVGLAATGATIYKWYGSVAGVDSLQRGPNFTTPSLTGTTTYFVSAISAQGCESASRTLVTATINTIPAAPAAVDASRCGTGTVGLAATGSTIYKWYGSAAGVDSLQRGQNYTTPSISGTTTYFVSAISAQGCESTTRTSVTATINTIPTAPVAVNGSNCGTGKVSLSATDATIYKWYGSVGGVDSLQRGQNYMTPPITGTTTYYVSAISIQGCESTTRTPVTATIFTIPAAPASNDSSNCGPGAVKLTATGAYAYRWFDASTNGTLVGSAQDFITPVLSSDKNYYVQALSIDNCLSATRTPVQVKILTVPAPPAGKDSARCDPGNVLLTVTGTETYKWYETLAGDSLINTGNTYLTPFLNNSKDYFISTTNTDKCESKTRTKITAVIFVTSFVPLGKDSSRCGPGEVYLEASGAPEFRWYSTETSAESFYSGAVYKPVISQTSEYFVAAVSPEKCESVKRAKVTAMINTIPPAPLASDSSRCGSGRVKLAVTNPAGNYYWYSTISGNDTLRSGSVYTTDSLLNDTRYYVAAVSDKGCISDGRGEVNALIREIPDAPDAVNRERCGTGSLTLSASGSSGSYIWYNQIAGGTAIESKADFQTPILAADTTYYVVAVKNGCESLNRKAVSAVVNPLPGAPVCSDSIRCGPGMVKLKVAETGSVYNWYTDSTGNTKEHTGSEFDVDVISDKSYYVTSFNGKCESPARTKVSAIVLNQPDAPTASDSSRCGPGKVSLSVSGSTSEFKWYNDGGVFLNNSSTFKTDSLQLTTSYFVASFDGICESKLKKEVKAIIHTLPETPVTRDTTFCGPAKVTLSAKGAAPQFEWYDSPASGTKLGSGQTFETDSLNAPLSFYVAGYDGTCYSVARAEVKTTVNIRPATPVAENNSRCGEGSLKLMASGSNMGYNWYESDLGGISQGTQSEFTTPVLAQTKSYFVATYDGKCESSARKEVQAVINNQPVKPVAVNASRCGDGNVPLSVTSPVSICRWYENAEGGAFFNTGKSFESPVLASTTSYFVASFDGICESAERTQVTATINTIPATPATTRLVARCMTGTVNLSAQGSSGSYKWYDEATGGNMLSDNAVYSPEVSKGSTFYVAATAGTCESSRISVNVQVDEQSQASKAGPDTTICENLSGTLRIAVFNGPIKSWQKSTDNFVSDIQNIENQASAFQYSGLTKSTAFRVVVKNGTCPEFYSEPAIVSVVNKIGGHISGTSRVLKSNNSGEIAVNGQIGDIVRWECSENNFLTRKVIDTSDVRVPFGNLSVSTRYIAIVNNKTCPDFASDTLMITVLDSMRLKQKDSLHAWMNELKRTKEGYLFQNIVYQDDYHVTAAAMADKPTAKGGIFSVDENGTFRYTPPQSYLGMDTLYYSLCVNEFNPSYCEQAMIVINTTERPDTTSGVYIYETLSPNNDGINDEWVIEKIHFYPENSVKIFDRWGNEVYSVENYDNLKTIWRGQSNTKLFMGNELPDDSYFYLVELPKFKKRFTGFVVLKR